MDVDLLTTSGRLGQSDVIPTADPSDVIPRDPPVTQIPIDPSAKSDRPVQTRRVTLCYIYNTTTESVEGGAVDVGITRGHGIRSRS